MQRLDIVAFPGASNWPLYVGLHLGLFKQHDLDVHFSLTPNSRHMAKSLHTGEANIALSSIDNVIAYVEGQGVEPLDGRIDFFAFMGVDNGLLSLMSAPGIGSMEELREKTLAVDAVTTGFAFVLRELLHDAGVGNDVSLVSVGSGNERLAHLNAGSCDATLLNAPLCLIAEASGKRRLARAIDILGSYQGIVGVARRSWAQQNAEALVSFIAGFHASLEWLRESANREVACNVLLQHMPNLTGCVDRAYEMLVVQEGLRPDLKIDAGGVNCVIRLRQKYGGKILPHGGDAYIDDGFRSEALRRARHGGAG